MTSWHYALAQGWTNLSPVPVLVCWVCCGGVPTSNCLVGTHRWLRRSVPGSTARLNACWATQPAGRAWIAQLLLFCRHEGQGPANASSVLPACSP
jgi:hypothetical protein